MGKENDAPKSTNIPSFNFQQNSVTMETLKKENDDLKRQNEASISTIIIINIIQILIF